MSFIKIPDKPYYRIGEVARYLGVETSALRYWGKAFPQLSPRRSPSGHRIYLQKDIDLLREIRRLLHDEGFTIAGAKKRLEEAPAPEPLPLPLPESDLSSESGPGLVQGSLFNPLEPPPGLEPEMVRQVLAELKAILTIVGD